MYNKASIEKERILEKIRTSEKSIVIFGAGVAGEAMYYLCRDAGISVSCFCDNNTNKAGKKLCDIPIMDFSGMKKNTARPLFLISAADIIDIIEQLHAAGYEHWYDASVLLEGFDVKKHPFTVPSDFAEYVVTTCVACHQAFSQPNKLFMRSVDIVITERCSLKCRDCSNLMQYYREPRNYTSEKLIQDARRLAGIADNINEVRVIGGEPLMNSAFAQTVRHLAEESTFGRVIIYTNGTICPPEDRLRHIRSPKVLFFITNYGPLSRNLERLVERLDKLGIQWHVQDARGWTQCGTLYKHFRDERASNAIFGKCCAKHLITLMNGSIYRCPFSANAEMLGVVKSSKEDRVQIDEPISMHEDGIQSLKQQIHRLLTKRSPLRACEYCEGRPYGAPEIEPAVQTHAPLVYEKASQ